jgi:hypothetical protein
LEAKEKQEELKEKLAEINQRLNELSENAISASENKNTENMDTFLADYRQKLDQLETLISNLTATDAPLNPTKVTEDSASSSKPNTWRALIDIKLKRVKDVISRISAVTSSKPAVTVTKYLPTSNLVEY